MNNLNCSKIIKENPKVLSWKEDIYLMHYVQKEEIIKANMCVHMNMLNIVLQGRKEILGYDSKTIVTAGSGLFMKKGSYLVTDKIEDQDKGYEAIILFFSDEWLQSQIDTAFSCAGIEKLENCKQNSDISFLPEDVLMSESTQQLKSYFNLEADTERLTSLLPFKIRELLQILISGPEGQCFKMQLQTLDTHLNPDLVRLMQSHYKENISLEQYAFLANCSLSTFKRKFNQTFKMNPGKWIMQRRLEEAYEMIANSEKNITEIAYDVGFETPAHFIASFKQKYRNTPKKLQQQL
tara:strand:+ start:4475 stop:5356 length:882 start_codon:yes stop_codon:yes gene_type:complete